MAGQTHKITVREKTPVPLYGGLYGVSDETRTRDSQDHNLVLYQLNYSHHYRIKVAVFSAHLCSELYGSPQWAGNKNSRSTLMNLGKGGVWGRRKAD